MSANLRIVPYNDHDDATLSTSTAPATGYDVTDTQNCIRSRIWKSVDGSAQSISGTLAASRTASMLALFRHSAQGADVRLQLYSDAAWTTQVYDSTALAALCYSASEPYTWSQGSNDPFAAESPYWLYFTATAYQSYKISFSGTPSAGYWSASRIFLGRHLELAVNPIWGLNLGTLDATDRNRSRGGSLRTNAGPTWRTLDAQLNDVEDAERSTWMQIMRQAGTGRDIVVSMFPGDGTTLERDHTINGKFSALDVLGRQVNRLTKRIQIEEC